MYNNSHPAYSATCVYCGTTDATQRDHVLPMRHAALLHQRPELSSQLFLVKCCHLCNAKAWANLFDSFHDKFKFLNAHARQRRRISAIEESNIFRTRIILHSYLSLIPPKRSALRVDIERFPHAKRYTSKHCPYELIDFLEGLP
jgi:hypothetical protein